MKKFIGNALKITLIGLLFMSSGCGFHLRGAHVSHIPLKHISLKPYVPEDRFQQKLIYALDAHGIELQTKTTSDWVLAHTPLQQTSTPMAYGPNGELVREKVILNLAYTLYNGDDIVLNNTLSAQRQHQISMNNELATQAERQLIIQDMEIDILQQLILQLAKMDFA